MALTIRKLYTALIVFVCATYTLQEINDPEVQEEFARIKDECSKEIGIAVAVVDKAWNENNFPDDDKLKCYLKCQLLKHGILTENGDVVDDELKKINAHFVDEATSRAIITTCGDVQDTTDLCEKAMKLMACTRDLMPNEVIH